MHAIIFQQLDMLIILILFIAFVIYCDEYILFGLMNLCLTFLQAQIMLGMVTPQVVCFNNPNNNLIWLSLLSSCASKICFWIMQLQMPNIRQPPGQPALHTLQDTQQGKQSSIQTLPGLPPLAQRSQSGLVSKMQEGQFSVVPQNSLLQNQFSAPPQPMQPRTQIPQHANSNVPQQSSLPGQSGVPPLLPIHSIRTQTQVANSSSLNKQIPPSLLQHSGQRVGTANFGHTSQMVLPSASIQSSVASHPSADDAFQVRKFASTSFYPA